MKYLIIGFSIGGCIATIVICGLPGSRLAQRKAFEEGCLAGIDSGIEVYKKRLAGKLSEAEAANAVEFCFERIKTNKNGAVLWNRYH